MDKPILTVLLLQGKDEVRASGLCEDEDVFRDVSFKSYIEAVRYFDKRYRSRFKVVLNVPRDINRGQA